MEAWTGLLLALALSLDGFLAGVSYGMRGIALPTRSLLILGVCSAAGFGLSMALGDLAAASFASPSALGGAILCTLGLWQLAQAWRHYLGRGPRGRVAKPLWRVRIRALGVVVQVLTDPGAADLDRSGGIDGREAALLGGALGTDAMGAGLAAAMVGLGYWLVPGVAAGMVVLTRLGLAVGGRLGGRLATDQGLLLSGLVLIGLGLLQF